MLGVVINPFFDWMGDRHPRTPYAQSVIYEMHVKGLTELHPDIPAEMRGTYAGAAHPAVIEHLQRLGVTAVELMPVHQFVHDSALVDRGLRNYWGYNTIGFFAPHNQYSSTGDLGQQVQEFKSMVRALHDAGIEVILDVVYNHTAEGNHLGPTLSFRGLDNQAYYRLVDDEPEYYLDYTGTGNSLNMRHPRVAAADHGLVALLGARDARRRIPVRPGVDARPRVLRRRSAVDVLRPRPAGSGRLPGEADRRAVGSRAGRLPGGQLSAAVERVERQVPRHRPRLLAGRTGDARRVRLAHHGVVRSLRAQRAASDGVDQLRHRPRRLRIADLVSYNEKHNEANGEDNNDGESHNRSFNLGVEGPTDDPEVVEVRRRQQRNFLTTLLLSQGVPMILHGDELGRTQGGNNNTYAQDNELAWIHWDAADRSLIDFVASVTRVRHQHPSFRRARFFDGRPVERGESGAVPDIAWFTPAGTEMQPADWDSGFGKAIAMFLNGDSIHGTDGRGQAIVDDSFLMCFNAHDDTVDFCLPGEEYGPSWDVLVDTAGLAAEGNPVAARGTIALTGRSLVLLRSQRQPVGAEAETGATFIAPDPAYIPDRHPSGTAGGFLMGPPVSTYRLQIHAGFDLDAAAELLPYLHELGVDWVYLSPLLESAPGSTHGYDVVDCDRVDPSRGGEAGLRRFADAAHARKHGGARRHRAQSHGRRPTARQPLVVGRARQRASVAVCRTLRHRLGGGRRQGPAARAGRRAANRSCASATGSCATTSTGSRSLVPMPTPIRRRLRHASVEQIHALQHYELVNWRRADGELNYRRFFAVNSLAGIRVEDRRVFEASHAEIAPVGARGPRRRAAHRPSRRARRPAAVSRRAGRVSPVPSTSSSRRSSSGSEQLPTPVGRRRHHRVRRAGRRRSCADRSHR